MSEFLSWDIAETMADLFARRVEELRDRPIAPRIMNGAEQVVISATGAAHHAARMVEELSRQLSRIPIVVLRGYDVPAWVDAKTVFIAVSATGADQELIYSVAAAGDRGARCVVVTGGSHLHQIASSQGYPEYTLSKEMDHPVLEIAGVFVTLWRALAGLFPLNQDELSSVTAMLARQAILLGGGSEDNPAKLVSGVLRGSTPHFYGSHGICGVSAGVWSELISRTTGMPCFDSEFPTLDEAAEAIQFGTGIHPEPVVLLLRDAADDDLMRTRIDRWLSSAAAGPLHGRVHEIIAEGTSPMERLWSSVYLGVWTGCWAAVEAV